MKVALRASLIRCLLMTLLLQVYGDDGDTLPSSVPAPRRLTRGSTSIWTTGVWGSWSMWSSCSRTCGRGVSTQNRECLEGSGYKRHQRFRQSRNHGNKSPMDEKLCLGISRRVQLCKIQDCKFPVDVRKELCEAFNDKAFRGRFHKWEPFVEDSGNCELRCQPVGEERFIATLAKVVEDGTPCGAYNRDDRICVAGECRVIGCDGIIGSTKQVDQCGVCGGQNTSCRRTVAYYSNPIMPQGYNSITVIPAGATNINISELSSSRNLLALKTADDGYFILNGNWSVSRPGDYRAAGTVFRYRRSDPWGYELQKVTAEGPTNRPIELFIVYHQQNRGVSYAYSLPVSNKRGHKKDTVVRNGSATASGSKSSYNRVPVREMTEVSKKGGPKRELVAGFKVKPLSPSTQRPTASSTQRPSSLPIQRPTSWPIGARNSNSFEDNRLHKTTVRSRKVVIALETAETSSVDSRIKDVLNDVAFNIKNNGLYLWRMTGFGNCSKPCGRGESQPLLKCFSKNPQSHVPDFLCNRMSKPTVRAIVCNKDACLAGWSTADWSSCSVSCGDGVQTRKVFCANGDVPVADDLCSKILDRPLHKQPCNLSCSKWRTSSWSKCTADCGKGTRNRKATCVNNRNEVISDDACLEPKPELEDTCFMKTCSGAQWISTEWRRCSSVCDSGTENRKVICLDGDKKVPGEFCDRGKRPEETRPCDRNNATCRKGSWFVGPWSQCSSACGAGSQTREVLCLLKEKIGRHQVTDDSLCSPREKPVAKQKCDSPPCEDNQWYAGEWSTCTKSCDSGRQTREVFCLSYGQALGEGCSAESKPATWQSCNAQKCQEILQGDRTSVEVKSQFHSVSNCSNQWSNCDLAVQAGLCKTPHYRDVCCHSCSKPRARRKTPRVKDMTRKSNH